MPSHGNPLGDVPRVWDIAGLLSGLTSIHLPGSGSVAGSVRVPVTASSLTRSFPTVRSPISSEPSEDLRTAKRPTVHRPTARTPIANAPAAIAPIANEPTAIVPRTVATSLMQETFDFFITHPHSILLSHTYCSEFGGQVETELSIPAFPK
jgi:hypothetical protein